jgi:hypothetical protein
VTHVVGPARPAFGREIGAMLRGEPASPHEVRLPPYRATSADLDWHDAGVPLAELGAMAAGALRRLTGRRSVTDDVLTATTRRPRPHPR